MRSYHVFRVAWLLLLCSTFGCGALSSLAEFNPDFSGVYVDSSIAPADGNTQVKVSVQLRYAAALAARGIPVNLVATGSGAKLGATSGVTDANGVFATTLVGSIPQVVRLAANIQGQAPTTALQASVQFVSVAAGASLALGAQATVGVPESATVTILDASGQRVLYYGGTVQFQSSDALAVLPPVYQFTAADQGQHSFDGITFQTAGTQNLVIQDLGNANITAQVDGIAVYLKTAPMLELSGIEDALAGTVGHVEVRAIDIAKHTQTDYTGTVHFTSTDAQAELPQDTTFTATDAGVKLLPVTLKTAGAQSVSAVDTNNLAINGTQSGIAVQVQSDRFAVSMPLPITAGVPVSVHAVAVDAYGNTDPNYVGPAVLSSSDFRALLPAVYAFTPADAGAHDANVTFFTAGRQSLEVQGASAGFLGQASATVMGGPVQRLALLASGQAVAGTAATLVATAYDPWGNVSNGYVGTLHIASSDANASLPPPVHVTAANAGSAVITPVILRGAGLQSVTITDADLALSANTSIAVNNAPASYFLLRGLGNAPAGTLQTLTASAFDAFANPALDYAGSVLASSDDPQAQLPVPTAFMLTDEGTRTFVPVVLKTAGLHAVSLADAANPNIRGTDTNLRIAPLAATHLTISLAAQVAVGVAQNVLVRALDPYGNLDPTFAGTVTLVSSDPSAGLPSPYTFGPADAGSAAFAATLFTSGSQTLQAQSSSLRGPPLSRRWCPAPPPSSVSVA